MKALVFDDSAWQTTFPHRVAPLPDEWFPGLLLRCDEANHWESGTTFRSLLHSTHHPGFGPGSSLIVIPLSMLEYLAARLLISVEDLLATTYCLELARLYPSSAPHSEHLLGPRRGANIHFFLEKGAARKTITAVSGFHICPLCLVQDRLLRRTIMIPHLKYCPTHHIAFHTHCACGCPLLLFSQGKRPFQCFVCGLDWTQLPCIQLLADQGMLEQDLWALYEFFLFKGTNELRAFALHLARPHMREHELFELKLSGRRVKPITMRALDTLSLKYLVDILVSVGISPKDIADGALSLS